jgi:hypothetical protein
MNTLSTVIAQIIAFSPLHEFRKCVKRYGGDNKIKSFSCFDQFLAMPFAQLACRERLRDIESCLRFGLGMAGRFSNYCQASG